jgi:hypothetical protein
MTYVTLTDPVVVLSRFSLILAPVPLPAGFDIPATAALVQAKVAPAVELVIVYAVDALSHIDLVAALVMTAVGRTVTTRLNGVPAQVPTLGMIIYVTLTSAVVVLSSDSFISAVDPLPAAFEIPATAALVHANVAPADEDVAVYARGVTSQTFFVAALVITAVGLTVTVRVNGVPTHPFIVGVMIYATLTGAVVVLSSDSLINAVAPLPAAFDIPATTARVHAKVQPGVALVAV